MSEVKKPSRKRLDLQQKLFIIETKNKDPKLTASQIQDILIDKYSLRIHTNTINDIYRDRENLIEKAKTATQNTKSFKTTTLTNLEQELVNWMNQARNLKIEVTDTMIKKQAEYYKNTLFENEAKDINFSYGWLEKFKKRNNLQRKKRKGDSDIVELQNDKDFDNLQNTFTLTPQTMEGKVALILGGSSSMGLEVAKQLAKKGVKVVLSYHTSKAKVDHVVQEILNEGGKAVGVPGDTSLTFDIQEMFNFTIREFNQVDYLINCAGIIRFKLIKDTTEKDFDDTFECNVKGIFFSMKEAATKLKSNGRIVNVGSSTSRQSMSHYGTYAASKAAVSQLTKTFSKEIGHRGITVNCVMPGPVESPFFYQDKTQEQVDRVKYISPFNRIGTPIEIANVISFICSPEASWITGQEIGVNGGSC